MRAECAARCRLYRHKRLLAATCNALLLQKCLKQRMWENTRFECRQVCSDTFRCAGKSVWLC